MRQKKKRTVKINESVEYVGRKLGRSNWRVRNVFNVVNYAEKINHIYSHFFITQELRKKKDYIYSETD